MDSGAAEFLVGGHRLADVPYAYAATVRQGGLILTAGICPLDERGAVVAAGDVAGQMRTALDNLRIVLARCGVALVDVVKSTIYVASGDRDDLVAAWNAYCDVFGDHRPPSTLVGVSVLGHRNQLIEIEAIALGSGS